MSSDRDPAFSPGETIDPAAIGETLVDAGSDEFAGQIEGEAGRVRASWRRSPIGAELTVWRAADGGRLLQAQLDVRGEVVQWDERHGARTGLVIEAEVAPGANEESVRFDKTPVRSALARAVEIIAAASAVPEAERAELAAAFAGSAPSASRQATASAPSARPPRQGAIARFISRLRGRFRI